MSYQEQEQTTPLEARPIQAVAVILTTEEGKIYTIKERSEDPRYGKPLGALSIPMETKKPGETEEEALRRLVAEEVRFKLALTQPERIGRYGIGIAAVTLYYMRIVERNGNNPDFKWQELADPEFRNPEELTGKNILVRQGVAEMIADWQSGARETYRTSCRPVPFISRKASTSGWAV